MCSPIKCFSMSCLHKVYKKKIIGREIQLSNINCFKLILHIHTFFSTLSLIMVHEKWYHKLGLQLTDLLIMQSVIQILHPAVKVEGTSNYTTYMMLFISSLTAGFYVFLQVADAGKSASQHHSLLVAANQAAVINAAKSASAAAGSSLSKTAVATLVKGAGNSATMTKCAAASAGAVVTVAKGITNMPVLSMSKGAGVGTVVGVPKSSGTSLVTAASLVSGMAAGGGKTGATLSGRQSRQVVHVLVGMKLCTR